MEEKKTIIINGKEFETYSPLTSQILECASYADRIGNADSLGLVTKYFTFLMKWRWAIIVFMPFALLMNGGITCDIILGIILIASYIWGNHYSECSKILIQLNFLGANSYSWDSFEAASNTLKEANYLIPKLKECEKQTEETKRWEMYLELVKEMDKKYGERKHMLGRPFKKGECTPEERIFREEKVQEARELGKIDAEYCIKNYLELVKERFDTYRRYKYSPFKLKTNYELQARAYYSIDKLHGEAKRLAHLSYNVYRPIDHKEHPWNILPFEAYKEELDKRFDEIIGHIYNVFLDSDIGEWKFASFVKSYIDRLDRENIKDEDYFSLDDYSCLEGKYLCEYRKQLQEYMDITEIFVGLAKYSYEQYCQAVDKFGLVKEDLIRISQEGRQVK